jgi:transposase
MRQLIVSAPDLPRNRLRGLTVYALTTEAARLRPARRGDPVLSATKASLCSLARRIQGPDDELAELDARIESLLLERCPELLGRFGVGPDTATALVVCTGDNPERLHSEPAWAHLCGVALVPAGSEKTSGRVRVDYAGDRQANSALWRSVMVRIAHHPETSASFARKVKEGRPKHEVIRLLKRYVRPRGPPLPTSRLKTAAGGLAHPLSVARSAG